MKISIFLPVFNRRDELQRSLRALIPEKGEHEVFAVDLGSTDGSQQVAKDHDWVNLIQSSEGLRSKALNAAVEKASGEILFFMEPGSLPARGWAQALTAHAEGGAEAGHLNCREVDASAKWAAALRTLGMKVGQQVLGGPASLNGVVILKSTFDKVSGFRPVPDFEWLAFAARLKEYGAVVKPVKHEILVSPAAGSRQANAWEDLKEDLLAAWKFRKSERFDETRGKRRASSAIIFGYDAFEKPSGDDFFKHAQEKLQELTVEIMQAYRGVEKIYFVGNSASNKLIGQPSGVEVIGKPRTALDKRFHELVEKIIAEEQQGLLLVKSDVMDLSHGALRQLSEGDAEEPCDILPEADSGKWSAVWLEQPALSAVTDWEISEETESLTTHLRGKIIRHDQEKAVKCLRNDSDARSLYYAGVLEQKPA